VRGPAARRRRAIREAPSRTSGYAAPVSEDRHLDWDGCANVRDLGGLPTTDGRRTRRGALVRADALDRLTAAGWAALEAHGVRTVVDLRNDDERGADTAPRPSGIDTIHVPHDGIEDRGFWDVWSSGPQYGTPLYYGPHLARFPQRSARVAAVVARARPGGVAVHCGIGRDRTGMVAMLLLHLVGVAPRDIAADYALSAGRVPALLTRMGRDDDGPAIAAHLEAEGVTAGAAIERMLATVDVEAALRAGGLTADDVAALRARLLEP
jgi:protein-tyrosine phosphatase